MKKCSALSDEGRLHKLSFSGKYCDKIGLNFSISIIFNIMFFRFFNSFWTCTIKTKLFWLEISEWLCDYTVCTTIVTKYPNTNLKLVSANFYQIFIFSPNDSPSKTSKMFFISSKKLFSLSRYSNFCIFPFLSTLSRLKRTNGSRIIYDAMNWIAWICRCFLPSQIDVKSRQLIFWEFSTSNCYFSQHVY